MLGERVIIVNDICGGDVAAYVAAATGERVENSKEDVVGAATGERVEISSEDVVGAATGERVKNSVDACAPCDPKSARNAKSNIRRFVIVSLYAVAMLGAFVVRSQMHQTIWFSSFLFEPNAIDRRTTNPEGLLYPACCS